MMFAEATMLLAQADGAGRVLVWSMVLILVLVGLFLGVVLFRRWLTRAEEPVAGGFTLADLRDLHRRGEMTDEEFELARAKIVESARKAALRDRVEEKPKRPMP